jgi:hypothetical protein
METIVMNGSELYFVENKRIRIKKPLKINGVLYSNTDNTNPQLPPDVSRWGRIDLVNHRVANFNIRHEGGFYEILSLA